MKSSVIAVLVVAFALTVNRFVWRLRHIVWIGEPFVDAGVEQLGEFIRIEAEQTQVVSAFAQLLQLDRQEIVIPICQVCRRG